MNLLKVLLLVIATLSSLAAAFTKGSHDCPINNHNCVLEKLDKMLQQHEYLKSGDSPGKRSGFALDDNRNIPEFADPTFNNHDRVREALFEKRRALAILKRLLSSMQEVPLDEGKQKAKRTCSLNLGGHCLTESLDRAKSMREYLSSYDSPGKRRRRDAQVISDSESRSR